MNAASMLAFVEVVAEARLRQNSRPTSASFSASTSGSPANRRFETSSVRHRDGRVAIAASGWRVEGRADRARGHSRLVSPTAG